MAFFNDFQQASISRDIALTSFDVVIPNGQDTTGEIRTAGIPILRIEMPAAFDGTKLLFEGSHDGQNYHAYKNSLGEPVQVRVSANDSIGIAPIDFLGINFIKIRSDATETADRTIKIITRAI